MAWTQHANQDAGWDARATITASLHNYGVMANKLFRECILYS